jgi:hypothetical protein
MRVRSASQIVRPTRARYLVNRLPILGNRDHKLRRPTFFRKDSEVRWFKRFAAVSVPAFAVAGCPSGVVLGLLGVAGVLTISAMVVIYFKFLRPHLIISKLQKLPGKPLDWLFGAELWSRAKADRRITLPKKFDNADLKNIWFEYTYNLKSHKYTLLDVVRTRKVPSMSQINSLNREFFGVVEGTVGKPFLKYTITDKAIISTVITFLEKNGLVKRNSG